MATLHEDVLGAGDIGSQLDILRPAFRDWNRADREADQSAFDRLTRILTAIYAFGLDAMQSKAALRELGTDCQVIFPGDKSDKNWWNPIIKLACGEYHPTETRTRKVEGSKDKTETLRVFEPGLALIKYAVALRALEQDGVRVEDVEQHVRDFQYENGTVKLGKWNGVIAKDRASRKASGQTKGRKMHDAKVLETAARNLLVDDLRLSPEAKAHISIEDAEFCLVWGYISDGVFVSGKRVEGDTFDAKARTLAAEYAKESEKADQQPKAPTYEPDFDVDTRTVHEKLVDYAEKLDRWESSSDEGEAAA